MSGAAQSALRLIWRMGLIVFPVLYPVWDAALICRALGGSEGPLLFPSLFSASQGEIFSSPGFTVDPWLLGERPHHMWCRWGTHKAVKDVFCVGNRLLEAGILLSLPADTTLLPRVCNTSLSWFECVLHWQVSHADMEATKAKFLHFLRLFLASHEPASHSSGCTSLTYTSVAALSLSHLAKLSKLL